MFDYEMCRKCGDQWTADRGYECPRCGPAEPEPKPEFCIECGGNDESPKGHCSDCIVVVDRLRELLHAVHGMRTAPVSSMRAALKIADEIEDLIVPGTSESKKKKAKEMKQKRAG